MRPSGPNTASGLTRRGFLAAAAGGAAAVSLPLWPARAHAAGTVDTTGQPVYETHPSTEPSGTHVVDVAGTGVLFAYGTVVPSFDGWRTREPERRYTSLDGRWRFAADPTATGQQHGWHLPTFDDRRWSTIPVPSSWDLQNTPDFGSMAGPFGEGTAFLDGFAWFRRDLDLDGLAGRHVRLNFLGVGYSADVWVDGRYLGKHEGASGAFSLPVPPDVVVQRRSRHTLAVRVYRRASYLHYANGDEPVVDPLEIPYKPVDYWPYAGITRSVWLEAVASTSIDKVLVDARPGALTARIVVVNHSGTSARGTVTFDPGRGSDAGPVSKHVVVAAGSVAVVGFQIALGSRARTWSLEDPTVLTARASLLLSGSRVGPGTAGDAEAPVSLRADSLTTTYGVREVAVDGPTLTLNGKSLFLKGTSWHEETAAHGRSMTTAEYDVELRHLTDLGVTLMRNCVYTRHPYVYDWSDTHGVTVLDEFDTMWLNTEQERVQTEQYGLARAMASTMAWNQHNHPSVVMWGLQNESEIDAGGAPVYRAWLADMKAAVKAVDLSYRPVTWASSTTNDPAFDIADVIGFNEYFGYFYGQSSDLGPAIDAVHAAFPDKPILITENGTWSLPGNHGPATTQGTEEWQAAYLQDHWDQVVPRQHFMCGYTLWVLKDYKERAGYNQAYNGVSVLGLMDFANQTAKLAYTTFEMFRA